ncbi:hypothetical protein USB125703_01587 [Pseudoclavibacter triregionum]|nr:hypothetical protein USB125703_01587 [Pseudoclavibacter triregionum]
MSSYSSSNEGALIFTTFFVTLIVTYVLNSLAYLGIFKKAGVPAWKAWVPVYNNWVFTQLGGYHGAISLVAFFVSNLILILPGININKAFGKEGAGWMIFMILLMPIWMFVIGFGSGEYRPERMGTGLEHVRAAGANVPAAAGAGYGQQAYGQAYGSQVQQYGQQQAAPAQGQYQQAYGGQQTASYGQN